MRARRFLLAAGLFGAATFPSWALPSQAFAAGASFSAEGGSVFEQVLWQGDGASETLWLLPVRPEAAVEFSSDALVSLFDQSLEVVVRQPANSCFTPHNDCNGVLDGGGVGGSPGTLFPIADPVMWPSAYSRANEPGEVESWFAGLDVTPPADLLEAVEAAELAGYGFLLMQLPAGSGLLSSPVVRITSSEASESVPTLAPRLDAEINLTVIANRRYEPVALPTLAIEEKDLEWNWTTMESSYYPMAGEAIAAGWLAEAAEPLSPYAFDKLIELALNDPAASGYDLAELQPIDAAHADVDALRFGLSAGSTWVTRLTTRVPAAGFQVELGLLPVDSLGTVDRDLTPAIETGAIPNCELEGGGGCEDDFFGDEEMGEKDADFGSCAASKPSTASGGGPVWLLAALLLGLGRKRRLPKG